MGKSEKPKNRRHTPSSSSEQAKLKAFLQRTAPKVLPYLEAMLEDAYQRLPRYRHADYLRDVATLRRRYDNEGLSFATRTLPDLFNALLLHLETGKPSYPSFRLVRGGKHPVFLRQLFAMVFDALDEQACTLSIQCLYQLCFAFKKLRGPYKQSTLQKQLWSFVEDDIDLRYIDFFSEVNYPILCKARQYVKAIFQGVDPEFQEREFVPVPGPGAVNTPRRKDVRYRPHVLYEQLDAVFPYEAWFYSHPWDIVTDPLRYKALKRESAPSSRFKFVPKTYGKPRGICIEELETQFLQQALKRFMYKRIESHPLTKGLVNFVDQGINGRLALEASSSGHYATLDMSAASDRVSRTLVRYLFHDCPEMRDALMATSTRTISLPDGLIDFIDDLPGAKFAPMGSATCFPVMALVHFVLIKAILALSVIPRELTREIYVYGDDIIVRTECVEAVYAYLPFFGMKFNTEKSYVHSQFRESCGMHAFRGVEITPAFFKHVPDYHSPRDVVLSLLKLESQLFKSGFKATARYLRTQLLKVKTWKGYDVPFVTPKSPLLGWIREDVDAPSCRHIGLKRRYNLELQRFEVRAMITRPSSDDLVIEHESEAYLRKFCDWGPQLQSPSHISNYRPPRRYIAKQMALTDHTQTTSSAHEVKDFSADPPWIMWSWCPESAL